MIWNYLCTAYIHSTIRFMDSYCPFFICLSLRNAVAQMEKGNLAHRQGK